MASCRVHVVRIDRRRAYAAARRMQASGLSLCHIAKVLHLDRQRLQRKLSGGTWGEDFTRLLRGLDRAEASS